jgi:hypothetical protein
MAKKGEMYIGVDDAEWLSKGILTPTKSAVILKLCQ